MAAADDDHVIGGLWFGYRHDDASNVQIEANCQDKIMLPVSRETLNDPGMEMFHVNHLADSP
jgi:hypothetical protein